MRSEKLYTIKVKDQAGNYLGQYEQLGAYRFSKVINGGIGAMSIKLPREYSNYNADGTVQLMRSIEEYVQDNQGAVKIYDGFINGISLNIEGGNQSIDLDIWGYASLLGFVMDLDAGSPQVVRNSMTPGEAVKDVVDKLNATLGTNYLTYTDDSIDITGDPISYTSDSKFGVETIERIRLMAPAGWWWYVDQNRVVYFKPKPTTATHEMTFGVQIASISSKIDADVQNKLLFWNGLLEEDTNFLQKLYKNSDSAGLYFPRYAKLTDSRIIDETYADELGNAYVNANKDPNITLTFTVKDDNFDPKHGYDIESLNPGDTLKIKNLPSEIIYSDNLLITQVDYEGTYAKVSVNPSRAETSKSLTDIRRSLDTAVYSDGVGSVTEVEV